jgi:CheY-like chemotaxis protein
MSPMIGHFCRLLRLPQKQPGLGRAVPSGSKEGEPDAARINWAANAQAALEFLATNEFSVDILFSDVVMPGMSGIELAEKVRRTNPDLRIVRRSSTSGIV